MKILAIGDSHGELDKIKQIPMKGIDLILLTGDLGKASFARTRHFENVERKKQGLPELKKDAKFVKNVNDEIHGSTMGVLKYLSKYAPVHTLLGNVGIANITDVKKAQRQYHVKINCTRDEINALGNVYIEKNKLRNFEGIKIGCLEYFIDVSWVKDFKPTDYEKAMKRAKKQTEKARKILTRFDNVGILLCHQPPLGILDKVSAKFAPKHWQGKHAGSQAILDYVKKYQPKYVFCGHIHEAEGQQKLGKKTIYNLGVGSYKIIEL